MWCDDIELLGTVVPVPAAVWSFGSSLRLILCAKPVNAMASHWCRPQRVWYDAFTEKHAVEFSAAGDWKTDHYTTACWRCSPDRPFQVSRSWLDVDTTVPPFRQKTTGISCG